MKSNRTHYPPRHGLQLVAFLGPFLGPFVRARMLPLPIICKKKPPYVRVVCGLAVYMQWLEWLVYRLSTIVYLLTNHLLVALISTYNIGAAVENNK